MNFTLLREIVRAQAEAEQYGLCNNTMTQKKTIKSTKEWMKEMDGELQNGKF